MLKDINSNFYNTLFNDSKIIKHKNTEEKNISEQLLTIRTLVLAAPLKNEMQDYVQLEKILAACKLQPQDYLVLQESKNSWLALRKAENIREILIFGNAVHNLDIPISFIDNQIVNFDSRVWIKSLAIDELSNNQQVKNDLWLNALKPHFINNNA